MLIGMGKPNLMTANHELPIPFQNTPPVKITCLDLHCRHS
jgi:hypothetical protein